MQRYFYPLDITYDTRDGRAIIVMYGRDEKNNQICVEHADFEPYFTIDADPQNLDTIRATTVEDYRITRIEPVTRTINGTTRALYHAYVNIPKGVPLIKRAIND